MNSDSYSSLKMKQNWAKNESNIPVIFSPSGPNPKSCLLGNDDFLIALKTPRWIWLLAAFVWPWLPQAFLIQHFPWCLMKFGIFLSPILCLSCLFRFSSCLGLGAHFKWRLTGLAALPWFQGSCSWWERQHVGLGIWNFFRNPHRTKDSWFSFASLNSCNNFWQLFNFPINHFWEILKKSWNPTGLCSAIPFLSSPTLDFWFGFC